MDRTYEEKMQIVASAFYNRFDEAGEPEILQKVFGNHDMSGPLALAALNGDIEIKTDEAKGWIADTYSVLDAIFSFPDEPPSESEADSSESVSE
jgi:hypothetical protein